MGAFRLMLAMAVMLAHIAELSEAGSTMMTRENLHIMVWSGHAVFAFFIISGFYITMILHERYSQLERGILSFYLNRSLRIYPVHLTILALYAAIYLVTNQPFFLLGDWPSEATGNHFHALFSNLFLFGVELLPMTDPANWQLVTGPIWSLSVELYFYLLAPFLVLQRLRWLLLLASVSFALRMVLATAGLAEVPWRYFFFPADMVFFLMGALSYRLSHTPLLAHWRKHRPTQIAVALMVAFSVTTPFLWDNGALDSISAWLFYSGTAFGVPLLFELTKQWRIDRLLGHLAYPVYLSHMVILALMPPGAALPYDKGVLAVIGTFLLSIALYYGVDRPVESIRHRIKQKGLGHWLFAALKQNREAHG